MRCQGQECRSRSQANKITCLQICCQMPAKCSMFRLLHIEVSLVKAALLMPQVDRSLWAVTFLFFFYFDFEGVQCKRPLRYPYLPYKSSPHEPCFSLLLATITCFLASQSSHRLRMLINSNVPMIIVLTLSLVRFYLTLCHCSPVT